MNNGKNCTAYTTLGGCFETIRLANMGQLLYLSTVTYGGGEKYFNVVISLDNLYVNQNIKTFFSDETVDFVFLNTEDQVLYSVSGQIELQETLQRQIPHKSGIKIGGKEYVCFQNNTLLDGLIAAYLVPEDVYYSDAATVRTSIFVTLIWCIILGIIMIIVFVKRNYRPIQTIMDDLNGKEKPEPSSGMKNEYAYIQDSIHNITKINRSMKGQLENQNKMVRSNILVKLIKQGSARVVPANKMLEDYGIYFIGERYATALFYLEDISELFADEHITVDEQLSLAHTIIENIATEIAEKIGVSYIFEVDEMLVCLWNFEDGKDANELVQEMKEACVQCRELICGNFDIKFTISLSRIHDGYEGIKQCFLESLTALEYRLVNGAEQILEYNDVVVQEVSEYYYPLKVEQKLLNSILAGDFQQSVEMADDVLKINVEQQRPTVQNVKLLIFDMAGTLYKAIQNMRMPEEENHLRLVVDNLFECDTIDEIKVKIHDVLSVLCDCVNEKKDTVQNILVRRVTEFIQTHYQEDSLSVAAMADQFGITPNYLSKIFKEVTGERLLNFIHGIRLEKAKELLMQEPGMTVEEVANMVGYNNTATFNRIFLKFENVPPKKWLERNS